MVIVLKRSRKWEARDTQSSFSFFESVLDYQTRSGDSDGRDKLVTGVMALVVA
jgi:hypothetical protein